MKGQGGYVKENEELKQELYRLREELNARTLQAEEDAKIILRQRRELDAYTTGLADLDKKLDIVLAEMIKLIKQKTL